MNLLKAGLLAGLIINLVDVPNSIFFAAPKLEAQLKEWSVTSSKLMPPYFVILHFVLGIALLWLYIKLKETMGFHESVLASWLIIVGLNRMFGFGNVLIGNMPWNIFAAFSWSFVVGTLLGTYAGAWLLG